MFQPIQAEKKGYGSLGDLSWVNISITTVHFIRDDSVLAAFIRLEDTSAENGGLAVFPGSHQYVGH